MGPNDVEIGRVWTAENPGDAYSDTTIETGSNFEVVVEAEVGTALHGTGGSYKVQIDVLDITNPANVNSQSTSGTFGDANWPAAGAHDFRFTIPAPAAASAGHQLRAYASVSAGGVGPQPPDVSMAESEMCILHNP